MNGSREIAKIASTESTTKMTSLISRNSNATSRGSHASGRSAAMDDGRVQRHDARQLVARVGLVVFVAVALSAVAYPGWFRFYAIATIPVLVGFGAASSVAFQGIEQNFTPWAGSFERINAYFILRVAGPAGRDRAPVARSETTPF